MKKAKILAASGAFALTVAISASAQMGLMRQTPQPRGFFNPIVGSGAQYEIQTDNGKTVMEVNVVGKESVDGKDGYWLETTMATPRMGDIVMKVLTVPDGKTITLTRTIMQMGDHPPMEMPMQMSRMNSGRQPVDIRNEAEDVGNESVTTPAGTFACEHYRMKDGSGDFWISDKVSPYGLIKHQGKETTMVLTKVIVGAKDKITGTPRPFNPMMMGGGGPPQQ